MLKKPVAQSASENFTTAKFPGPANSPFVDQHPGHDISTTFVKPALDVDRLSFQRGLLKNGHHVLELFLSESAVRVVPFRRKQLTAAEFSELAPVRSVRSENQGLVVVGDHFEVEPLGPGREAHVVGLEHFLGSCGSGDNHTWHRPW